MHLFPDHAMLLALERHFGTPTDDGEAQEKQLAADQPQIVTKPKVFSHTFPSFFVLLILLILTASGVQTKNS
jgi:ABC-type transport system involved in cytochrome c biogenesis permease component